MKKEPRDYTTFLRSCTNWREFSQNPKIIQETGLTYSEARERCQTWKDNRTESEIASGTMLEFMSTDSFDYRGLAEFEKNN